MLKHLGRVSHVHLSRRLPFVLGALLENSFIRLRIQVLRYARTVTFYSTLTSTSEGSMLYSLEVHLSMGLATFLSKKVVRLNHLRNKFTLKPCPNRAFPRYCFSLEQVLASI